MNSNAKITSLLMDILAIFIKMNGNKGHSKNDVASFKSRIAQQLKPQPLRKMEFWKAKNTGTPLIQKKLLKNDV